MLRLFIFVAGMFGIIPAALAGHLALADVLPQNISELPFYGHVQKSQAMIEADEKFKAAVIKIDGTAERGAQDMLGRAWQQFGIGKINIAMRRVNEAWLLNPNEGGVYWYLAMLQDIRGAPRTEVDDLFQQAFKYIEESRRAQLEHDYAIFKANNEGFPADNLAEIAAAYPAARDAVLAKMK